MAFTIWFLLFTKKWLSKLALFFFSREYDDTYNKIQLLSKMISVVQITNQYRNKEKEG